MPSARGARARRVPPAAVCRDAGQRAVAGRQGPGVPGRAAGRQPPDAGAALQERDHVILDIDASLVQGPGSSHLSSLHT